MIEVAELQELSGLLADAGHKQHGLLALGAAWPPSLDEMLGFVARFGGPIGLPVPDNSVLRDMDALRAHVFGWLVDHLARASGTVGNPMAALWLAGRPTLRVVEALRR